MFGKAGRGRHTAGIGRGLCLAGAALGVLGFVGWISGVEFLRTLIPGLPPMVPNTALGLLVAGLTAALRWRGPGGRAQQALAVGAGILVLVLGGVSIAEYVLDRSLGIDRLIGPPSGGEPFPAPHPVRPSPLTALAFACIGGALVLFDVRPARRARPSEWLEIAAALIALASLVGHAYGTGSVYQFEGGAVIGVALPTALALLLIAAGMLLERPHAGFMRLVTSRGAGGFLLRWLGLIAILAPALLGLIALRLIVAIGLRDAPLTLAILTTVTIPIGLVLLAIVGSHLNRIHEELEESRNRLHTLVEQAVDGIFIADQNGRYTDVNSAGCRMLGYTRDELIGKLIVDLIPHEDAARFAEERELLRKGSARTVEGHLRRKDGTYLPVEVSNKILPDGRWQAFVRDITRRKEAEEALRRSEARFEGIISLAADAIISINAEQRIVLYNEGAARIFGWPRAEALGKPLDILIPERLREVHRAHVQGFAAGSAQARRMGERGTTILGLRKNGEEFPAEACISKLQGDEVLLTVMLRDVSEARRIENAQRFLYQAAQKAIQARDEVLSIVAHDLRTPLSAAHLAVSTLLRQEAATDQRVPARRSAEMIQRSLNRASRLIDDLLDITRIEVGRLEIEARGMSPEELVRDSLQMLAPLAANASLELEADVRPGLPLVQADEQRLHQVFSNLIGNAIKFTPAGGHIRVAAERYEGLVRFAVSDTGAGIPPEYLPHLFDRFWQAQRVNHRGAGLGLAIVKGIVEAHGGRIWVESTPGKGSTFYFTLPIAPALETSPPSPG
jgi:PAS domain S-box-containing protein